MKRIVIGFLLSLAVSFAAFGQWNPQKSNTTASLQGLSIVNANVVWASGTGGTFVRTTVPDFTILWRGEQYYWEHLGLLVREDYRRKWETKRKWYEKNFAGKLVITEESGKLSVDAQQVIETGFT
jgi:hypothetical protein